jgi:hypothetical protein
VLGLIATLEDDEIEQMQAALVDVRKADKQQTAFEELVTDNELTPRKSPTLLLSPDHSSSCDHPIIEEDEKAERGAEEEEEEEKAVSGVRQQKNRIGEVKGGGGGGGGGLFGDLRELERLPCRAPKIGSTPMGAGNSANLNSASSGSTSSMGEERLHSVVEHVVLKAVKDSEGGCCSRRISLLDRIISWPSNVAIVARRSYAAQSSPSRAEARQDPLAARSPGICKAPSVAPHGETQNLAG